MAYTTVENHFWTDPKIKKLSPLDRYLALYFLTNRHLHYSGLYYIELDAVVRETGMQMPVIMKGLVALAREKILAYDEKCEVVWICKKAKYSLQRGNLPNMIRGIEKHFGTLHHSVLIESFLKFYKDLEISYNIPSERDAEGIQIPSSICIGTGTSIGTGKKASHPKKKEKEKIQIGESIYLTQDQIGKLIDRMDDELDSFLEWFDAACTSKGYDYKSHYAAMVKWGFAAWEKHKKENGIKPLKEKKPAPKVEKKELTPEEIEEGRKAIRELGLNIPAGRGTGPKKLLQKEGE